MEINTYTVIYLITNIFNTVIIRKLVLVFFKNKHKYSIPRVLAYCAYFVITSILYLFVEIPIVILIANFFLIYFIVSNYETCISRKVMSTLYVLMFCIIPEVVVTACTGYFSYSIYEEGYYRDSFGLVLTRILTYIEALLLAKFDSVRKNHRVGRIEWIACVIIPVSTIILFMIILCSGQLTQMQLIVAVCLIYTLNITVFYLYDSLAYSYRRLAESAEIKKEKELYYSQCKMMMDSTEELRAFRHDINNQLIALGRLLDIGKYEEAASLLLSISGKSSAIALPCATGNILVDSIVNYKFQCAKRDRIEVKSEIRVPYDFDIDISDCITIIGNLLDNAISALRLMPESERHLFFMMVYDRGRLIIQCRNPYINNIIYRNGRYDSTKQDNKEHGIGLKSVERLVNKYNGCIEVQHKENIFVVEIIMYMSNSN